jgi:hypothetical protein
MFCHQYPGFGFDPVFSLDLDPVPDPDPIRIQSVNDQKFEFVLYFFDQKCNLLIPRPNKGF